MRFAVDSDGWLYKLDPNDGSPALIVKPLPQALTQAMIVPWMIINHTQASGGQVGLESAWSYDTHRTDGIEAHLLCAMDGTVMQTMPFTRRADTSYKANSFYVDGVLCGQVSVESQDLGSATVDQTPWAPAQLESLCQAWAAVCKTYGIPVQPVPSAFGRGVSQHNAFPEWSKSGHSCPGTARTAQMPAMLDRIKAVLTPPAPVVAPPIITPQENYLMSAAIAAIYKPNAEVTAARGGEFQAKWFVLQASGDVRRATGADVAFAAAVQSPTIEINSPEHYDVLAAAAA